MRLFRHSQRNAEQGFTLIEVLVTFLLLAIGLLGIASLQLAGLRFNHDSYLRSQTTLLMYDIVDRMRMNSANSNSYVGTLTTTGTPPTCNQATAANAANDLNCWQAQLMDAVPPGTTAAIANPSGNEYTITITWTDRENTTRNIAYQFEP